jgi:hypothetical protein
MVAINPSKLMRLSDKKLGYNLVNREGQMKRPFKEEIG